MFQFQYEYTLEDMDALSRVTAKTYRRKKVLIYRTVLAVLGLAYLGMGFYLFSANAMVGGILIAAGLLFAAISLFFHRGTAWRSKRMMVNGGEKVTVILEPEGVRGKSRMGEDFCPYTAVIGGYHYRERYFLFLDKRHAMLLPEKSLTQGEPAALKGFLEEKLEKEIIEIHG